MKEGATLSTRSGAVGPATHHRRRKRPRSVRLFLAWLPALLGVLCIACESTEVFSAANTSGPLRLFWQSIFGAVSNAYWEEVHHLIRKTGHFTGYGTLSLLFYHAWRRTAEVLHRRTFRIENVIYALACTLVIAAADEFHQSFLPSRTGTPQDVLLDMIGACTLHLLFWLVTFVVGITSRQPHAESV